MVHLEMRITIPIFHVCIHCDVNFNVSQIITPVVQNQTTNYSEVVFVNTSESRPKKGVFVALSQEEGKQIEGLIVESKIEEALQILIDWSLRNGNVNHQELILLKSNLNHIEKNCILNCISFEEECRLKSKIKRSVLELLRQNTCRNE